MCYDWILIFLAPFEYLTQRFFKLLAILNLLGIAPKLWICNPPSTPTESKSLRLWPRNLCYQSVLQVGTNQQMGSRGSLSYLKGGISAGKWNHWDRALTWGITKCSPTPWADGVLYRCVRPSRTSPSCLFCFVCSISGNWTNYAHLAKKKQKANDNCAQPYLGSRDPGGMWDSVHVPSLTLGPHASMITLASYLTRCESGF